jgi:hypothetical protein
MKDILIKVLFLFLTVSLISCSKENSDEFTVDPTRPALDTNWVALVTTGAPIFQLKQQLFIAPKVDSIDASANSIATFQDGLQVNIPANSLRFQNGQQVTGRVFVEGLVLRKKGDLIRLDRPTVSNGRQLIAASNAFVRFRKNGEELVLAPGRKVAIRYHDIHNANNVFHFSGDESVPGRFQWVQTQDTIITSGQTSSHCEVNTHHHRWSGLHYFADTSGPSVNMLISLPATFTNANTSVYIVYKDVRSVLQVHGNPVTKTFISNKLPVGKQVNVVVVSKQGPSLYYLAHQQVTTGANTPANANQVVILRPHVASVVEIKGYLETLN